MRNLWDKVNSIDYNVPYYEVDIKVYDELEKVLESIDKNHEGYKKIEVLRNVFLLSPDEDDSKKPYKNRYLFSGGERSLDIDDFTEEMQNTLKAIIDENVLESTYMLCRVLDVYFILSNDHFIREKSLFPTLMKLIDETLLADEFSLSVYLIKRGFQLFGRSPRKNIEDEKTKILIEKVDGILAKYDVQKPLEEMVERYIYNLLELLGRYRFIKNEKYPEIANNITRVLEGNENFISAIKWWELCSKWNYKMGEDDLARECVKNKALCLYKMANKELEKETVNYFIVIEKIDSAILNLRKVKGNEELVKQWMHEKREYEKESLGQLTYIESPEIDMTPQIEEIKKRLAGKHYMEILRFIGDLAKSPDYERGLQENTGQISIATFLFQKKNLNGEGKNIYTSKEDKEFPEHLIQKYNEHYNRIALYVQNSLEILHNLHFLRMQQLLEITSDNPFVPEGREVIVAKGLREGLKGDYVTSLAVLIPQFENSIRSLLEQNGEIATTLGEDTAQEEKNLNQLLLDEKLVEIFGVNAVKDMKYLFVYKGGCNLRNKVSHGLMCTSEFYSDAVVYAFALMLRFILHSKCRLDLSS
ncbi:MULTISPECIES: DUF4209 domain-containing protein [Bacillus cereus group]|uniref:DUF4209 domain-containing protein n=1 Tax=Bacillus cereus group TaxID=86661 RepID=UPI00187A82CE|nr:MULTISPECIES: DUF4209 domain-containing protein [Bacillus cereus group]MBE7145293.1 DUF4209 domain-containing protein [Bacillus paranthracis]MCU5211699.1 DUF4209 domain-containing protein [Bacillus paranthracis]MDA2146864.1 DUF4209 domain-containing protein [Bacillus cereus group sp. Bc248]MDA2174721.1 DUF4209 domain-containing protein [Bacillus cereus group sp. Bc247]MDA2593677.1 DUF4209 domain-containing protein [Bacillus cereus group sp. Bc065]